MRRLCVFCGSTSGQQPEYRQAAIEVGSILAERKVTLVYGGGKVGLMGALADSCLAAGGEVIGVIPGALVAKEVAHEGVTELIVTGSMHERKALMAEMSDGFLTLPGGFGTFEEFCEIVTWAQLGLHHKPCALLNVGGYYDPLIAMIERAQEEGFIRSKHCGVVWIDTDVSQLIDRMLDVHAESSSEPLDISTI